jgi:hypothetical protein
MGAPSNAPPTRPSLARNSAIVFCVPVVGPCHVALPCGCLRLRVSQSPCNAEPSRVLPRAPHPRSGHLVPFSTRAVICHMRGDLARPRFTVLVNALSIRSGPVNATPLADACGTSSRAVLQPLSRGLGGSFPRRWTHICQCLGHVDPFPLSRSSAVAASYTVLQTVPKKWRRSFEDIDGARDDQGGGGQRDGALQCHEQLRPPGQRHRVGR